MKIRAVHLRRFRGLLQADLSDCSGLNVIIGRNNAGKSSILNAVELGLDRLGKKQLVSAWKRSRPEDEFFERDHQRGFEIGLVFEITEEWLAILREEIAAEHPSIRAAMDQLEDVRQLSVILSGTKYGNDIAIAIRSLSLGEIAVNGMDLQPGEHNLISLATNAVTELNDRENRIAKVALDISALERTDLSMLNYAFGEGGVDRRHVREAIMRGPISSATRVKVDEIFEKSTDSSAAQAAFRQLQSDLEAQPDAIRSAPLDSELDVFGGSVKSVPRYVLWILTQFSERQVLSFKERRSPIGKNEATQILRLKTKRGGAEALSRIQNTVQDLLGVRVDAFEPESVSGRNAESAEMDVDNFLVEVNGAGIREALRIILDLELKQPDFALIEEPEVHLHPGLERVLHGYLVEKSSEIQLFIATHSANFLDASSRQNVYLVSKPKSATATVERVATGDDLVRVSEEVGLRPSTVLMFDQILFIEGPSDENILRDLSKKLRLDVAAANSTFVVMGGASRFNQFAAEATLELLSRRRISMVFLLDRDEREDPEIKRVVERVGERAKVHVLQKRELENYLLEPSAIARALREKSEHSGAVVDIAPDEIKRVISDVAEASLDRVVDLRVSKVFLKPIYPNSPDVGVRGKLEAMQGRLQDLLSQIDDKEAVFRSEVSQDWPRSATKVVPGSLILEAVFEKYGFRYKKDTDGVRIAKNLGEDSIDPELKNFLRQTLGKA